MKIRRKKRTLTLLEIMIVLVLIGLIGSVIGVNMKGSLDEGKAFKTRRAREQIKDILMLEVASRGLSIEDAVAKREVIIKESGLVKDPKSILNDGWGVPFEVTVGSNKNTIKVVSQKLKSYEQKKNEKLGIPATDDEEDED
jgi:general secretion pathway protein G